MYLYFLVIKTMFVKEGYTVNFSCPFRAVTTPITWRGPQNLTTYSINNIINRDIFQIHKVTVNGNSTTGRYNLSISNFSMADAGLYRCDTLINTHSMRHEIIVHIAGKILMSN